MSLTNQNNSTRQPESSPTVINTTDQSTYSHTKTGEDKEIMITSTSGTSCEIDRRVEEEEDNMNTPEFWYKCFGQKDSYLETCSHHNSGRRDEALHEYDINSPQFWYDCFGQNSLNIETKKRRRQILDDLLDLEKIVSYGWKRLSY